MRTPFTSHQRLSLRGLVFCLLVLAAGVTLILLAGCNSSPNTHWWAPATWFSHSAADAVDRTAKVEDTARQAVVKQAQRSAHETSLALAAAPASRPVAVAADTNSSTVALLDQAAGPLDAGELSKLRATIAGLLSDNAKVRAEAERQRAEEQASIAKVSAALAKAESRSDAAEARLRAAFERENALANELRSQRALLWIAAAAALLCAAGWVYVRVALGGIPLAAGKAMRDLRSNHPSVAGIVEPILDRYLNRHEQQAISKHAL